MRENRFHVVLQLFRDNKQHADDAMVRLFGVLLADFQQHNLISRVQPDRKGKIPSQRNDPVTFRRSFGQFFSTFCDGSYDDLSVKDQQKKLNELLFYKFSVDPDTISMLPAKKGNVFFAWRGFYITHDELPEVVERVLKAYNE